MRKDHVDWFHRLVGFSESTYQETKRKLWLEEGRLRSRFTSSTFGIGCLEVISLGELRKRLVASPLDVACDFSSVYGDARLMHRVSSNAGAVFQVASQCNLLEMSSPWVTPEDGVSRYELDNTQGPACAIAAGAGTIYRNYFAQFGGHVGQSKNNQIDTLDLLRNELASRLDFDPAQMWLTQNGYVFLSGLQLARIDKYLSRASSEAQDSLRALVKVGLHWDVECTEILRYPTHHVSQVYAAALPVSLGLNHGLQLWRRFAKLVLEAVYEATIFAGHLNRLRGNDAPVYLTSVGGGAFGNSNEWILEAVSRALAQPSYSPLKIRMVHHKPGSYGED